jgi:hypothetical protein
MVGMCCVVENWALPHFPITGTPFRHLRTFTWLLERVTSSPFNGTHKNYQKQKIK